MTQDPAPAEATERHPFKGVLAGFALALAIAFSVYLMMNSATTGGPWVTSIWFLTLLPAVLCALICYIGDPDRDRSAAFYWWVPVAFVALVDAGSAVFLHEGVVCLLMLSPLWLVSGWIGAFVLRSQRRRQLGRNALQSSFLIAPLVAAGLEAQIPIPHEPVLVTRSILVHARADEIWPYAVSNVAIGEYEGRWTVTHNIIGLPRPRAAVLNGAGAGAVRTAYWGDRVNFQERITEWAPGRRLGWTFDFSTSSLQDYADKHISPDGRFLKIDSGGYTIRQISPETAVVTLDTRYIAMTHVNPYAELWGELFLGDVEDNILTIIKDRSEAAGHFHALFGACKEGGRLTDCPRSRSLSAAEGLGGGP